MSSTIRRDAVTLLLAALIALGTFAGVIAAAFALITGMGVIFPLFVAWASASVFALSRNPRHGWLHVAILGVVVASFLSLYLIGVRVLFPPPPGFAPAPGGPNTNPPPRFSPIPP